MNKKSFIKGIAVGIICTIFVYVIFTGINIYSLPGGGLSKTEWYHFMSKANTMLTVLDKKYIEDLDYDKMVEGMYYGLIASVGDPYTMYMDKDRFSSFMEETEGTYAGIGVSVSTDPDDGLLTIMQVFKHAPAEASGIMTQDKIIGVNGEDVSSLDSNEIIKKIKGPEGTDVDLTIYRQSEGKSIDIKVTRQTIEVPTVEHKMLDDNIGYIQIISFDEVTTEQFAKAFQELQNEGMEGLVIDLRNNPGGRLDVVLKITDLFVPQGNITYTIDANGDRKDYPTVDNVYFNKPLAVLVNGFSASASEIFSGAVKDYEVGTLVGTTTFGKGLVQNLYPLTDGSAVKVTISKYFTPNGNYINKTGIEPDVAIETPEEYLYRTYIPYEEDVQLQKAQEVVNDQLN